MFPMAWLTAVTVLAVTFLGSFVRKAYIHRSRINQLQKQGVVSRLANSRAPNSDL
jgi:hypothetical protein